jgi:hypothetical protein
MKYFSQIKADFFKENSFSRSKFTKFFGDLQEKESEFVICSVSTNNNIVINIFYLRPLNNTFIIYVTIDTLC